MGSLLKYLCLIVEVGWREVEMLIYVNVLESETHLIGSEIRINEQQNLQNLRCTLFYDDNAYKNIDAQSLLNLGIV